MEQISDPAELPFNRFTEKHLFTGEDVAEKIKSGSFNGKHLMIFLYRQMDPGKIFQA